MRYRLVTFFFFFFFLNVKAQKYALIYESDSIRLYDTYLSMNSSENMFPSIYGDGLIYSSTYKSNSYNPFYTDLQSKSIKIKLGSRFFLGPVAVFDKEIYFTGNSRSMSDDGFYNLTIFKGSFDNLKVKKPRELPILNKNFEYSHPSLSKEGDMMVVVSNEKGRYHLLSLTRNENDEWERGEIIFIAQPNFMLLNPIIYDKNTIYFSSNFFEGKVKGVQKKFENGKLAYTEVSRETGVFNIYKTVKENGIWQLPKKVYELNSEFDDLGVIFTTKKSGYLTTFRYNNTDNIYYFELK